LLVEAEECESVVEAEEAEDAESAEEVPKAEAPHVEEESTEAERFFSALPFQLLLRFDDPDLDEKRPPPPPPPPPLCSSPECVSVFVDPDPPVDEEEDEDEDEEEGCSGTPAGGSEDLERVRLLDEERASERKEEASEDPLRVSPLCALCALSALCCATSFALQACSVEEVDRNDDDDGDDDALEEVVEVEVEEDADEVLLEGRCAEEGVLVEETAEEWECAPETEEEEGETEASLLPLFFFLRNRCKPGLRFLCVVTGAILFNDERT
jgi:hypothetical protein